MESVLADTWPLPCTEERAGAAPQRAHEVLDFPEETWESSAAVPGVSVAQVPLSLPLCLQHTLGKK